MSAPRLTVRFARSSERIAAPDGYSAEQAARWALHLYHPEADRRVTQLDASAWRGTNGRRGPDRRGTVVYVEAAE